MRPPRTLVAAACLLTALLALAGCGDDDGSAGSGKRPAPPAESTPAPAISSFPATSGQTLGEVLQGAEGPAEMKIQPQAMVFNVGPNRYPFGVFEKSSAEREGAEVDDAEVALYYAEVPPPRRKGSGGARAGRGEALDQPAVGPFPAKIETLATEPRFEAKSTAEDPKAARVVYTAEVPLPHKGQWRLAALIREDGELRATPPLQSANAGEFNAVPRRGQKAPLIHTPTAQDVGGAASKITTRVPPDTQNEVDYADALGKEPILLLFATPKFCQSRVCGPVVDVAEQAKAKFGEQARFIHMEIFNDNDPSHLTVLPQVRAFHLPSEPWLFAIGREGVVKAAIEGGFGTEQMDEAVEKVVGK